MRICYITNSAIPSTSANSIATTKICEAFSELKNEVILITRNIKNSKDIFEFYDIKFKFKIKKIKNFNQFPIGIKYYLFSIISIFESLSFKPDLYITRNFFTCFLLTILRKKTVFEIHHDLDIESRIVRFLFKNFNFLNSKYILKIVAISKYAKSIYIDKYSSVKQSSLTSYLLIILLTHGDSPVIST